MDLCWITAPPPVQHAILAKQDWQYNFFGSILNHLRNFLMAFLTFSLLDGISSRSWTGSRSSGWTHRLVLCLVMIGYRAAEVCLELGEGQG